MCVFCAPFASRMQLRGIPVSVPGLARLPRALGRAALLTEHAAKHAHPERASRAEGSLLAASPPIPALPTQLLSRQHIVRVSSLDATLMSPLVYVANKRLTIGLNPLDATLTKNTGEGGPSFPFWNSPLVSHPCIQALSFHALTHCPFCNSSLFTHMHVMGGVPPHHPGGPLVHSDQFPVQLRFSTSHESPVPGSHPPVPNSTDGRTLQRVHTPCAILPFLRSADRPFLPPRRSS